MFLHFFKKIQFFSIDPLNAKQQSEPFQNWDARFFLYLSFGKCSNKPLHLLLQKASGNPSASGCKFSAIYLLFAKEKTNKQKSYGHFPLSLFRKMQQQDFGHRHPDTWIPASRSQNAEASFSTTKTPGSHSLYPSFANEAQSFLHWDTRFSLF